MTDSSKAKADLKRMVLWIVLAGILMVVGALWYTAQFGPLTVASVSAIVGGVFLSILLGCGLFALAFYSDKSGHDERSRNATDHSKDRAD